MLGNGGLLGGESTAQDEADGFKPIQGGAASGRTFTATGPSAGGSSNASAQAASTLGRQPVITRRIIDNE